MACTERAFTVSGGQVTLGAVLSGYKYEYDANNNLTKLVCNAAGGSWDTVYTYDKDNRPKTTTFSNGKVLTNTYDGMGRVTRKRLGLNSNYDTNLTYVPGANGSQTPLLASYQNGSDAAYEYAYDDNGNISSITRGTTSVTYQYNGANELVRENNGFTNQTVTYEYDVWGNLRFKKTYAYTTVEEPTDPIDTKIYGYSTGEWKDQLLTFGAETIVYDAMGNPTSYRGKSLTWRGKQLTVVRGGTHDYSFTYDSNGLRQQKTEHHTDPEDNVNTNYYYNGSVLIGLVKGNDTLRFSYDAAGKVQAVDFNGTYYYYLRNGQGDIVKLIDGNRNTVVEYAYDSWGKPLSCTGTLATTLGALNPFRYRGYVYDQETGFYYLKSRYYDPETCRFISADVLLSTGQGVLGHNCYAYCLNNPIKRKDQNGYVAVCNFLTGCVPPDDDSEDPRKRKPKARSRLFENCYQFATGLPLWSWYQIPGDSTYIFENDKKGYYDNVEDLIHDIQNDFYNAFHHKKKYKIEEYRLGDPLNDGEWVVVYCFSYQRDDYHFLRYDVDTGWSHKCGRSKPASLNGTDIETLLRNANMEDYYNNVFCIKIYMEDK